MSPKKSKFRFLSSRARRVQNGNVSCGANETNATITAEIEQDTVLTPRETYHHSPEVGQSLRTAAKKTMFALNAAAFFASANPSHSLTLPRIFWSRSSTFKPHPPP